MKSVILCSAKLRFGLIKFTKFGIIILVVSYLEASTLLSLGSQKGMTELEIRFLHTLLKHQMLLHLQNILCIIFDNENS